MGSPEARQFKWLAEHVDYFRQGLKSLSQTAPNTQFELPEIARQAARLDPGFVSERRVGDRVLAIVSRTSPDSIVDRRERSYLDSTRHSARGIMRLIVGVGEAESTLISPILLDDGYGRGPNEDGCLYQPASDLTIFDRPFSEVYLPHLADLARQRREVGQGGPAPVNPDVAITTQ